MNRLNSIFAGLFCLVASLAGAPQAQAQTTTVEYLHTDALGTPVAVTDAAGAVIERSEYEPYGQLVNRPLTDGPGFTGHVQDAATGLTYMQQRYYDPMIGRFLSVDPVTAYSMPGANFNRYWYASNSPYNFKDPDGRDDEWFTNVDPMGNPGFGNELGDDAFHYSAKALGGAAYGGFTVRAIITNVVSAFINARAPEQAALPKAEPEKEVVVQSSRHPESAQHIRDAQSQGHPSVLTVNRAGAKENRRAALQGTERQAGKDRDEYPPAMFSEGGAGSSVRSISPSDNRGAGACIGAQCKGLPDGTKVRIRVEP